MGQPAAGVETSFTMEVRTTLLHNQIYGDLQQQCKKLQRASVRNRPVRREVTR